VKRYIFNSVISVFPYSWYKIRLRDKREKELLPRLNFRAAPTAPTEKGSYYYIRSYHENHENPRSIIVSRH